VGLDTAVGVIEVLVPIPDQPSVESRSAAPLIPIGRSHVPRTSTHPAPLYHRHLQPRIAEALADTPVVLLSGPRQASLAGQDFRGGVVLYDGTETLPIGPKLWALPLSSLWLS